MPPVLTMYCDGGGYKAEHIIVMMADDIAMSTMNPCPGMIFNRPNGPDVYDGVKIDYKGNDVNAANFLAVLAGNFSAMKGVGTGRVIASGPEDRVFVFYSDHGSTGIIGMPFGPFLYADELHATMRRKFEMKGFKEAVLYIEACPFLYADELHATMRRKFETKGYKEAVLYIEACESGSMFQFLGYGSINAYVATASNPTESSWGTYCPVLCSAVGCSAVLRKPLTEHFALVKKRTSDNFTFNMVSYAEQYGKAAIEEELAGDYIGMGNSGKDAPPFKSPASNYLPCVPISSTASTHVHHVEQREADLIHLKIAAQHSKDPLEKSQAQRIWQPTLETRIQTDASALHAVRRLFLAHATSQKLVSFVGLSHETIFASTLGSSDILDSSASALVLEQAETESLAREWVQAALAWEVQQQRQQGTTFQGLANSNKLTPSNAAVAHALVDDWDCLRAMVAAWGGVCGKMNDYSMRHSRMLANLCNAGIEAPHLAQALQDAPCAQINKNAYHAYGHLAGFLHFLAT
eukprot:gene20088-26806_t